MKICRNCDRGYDNRESLLSNPVISWSMKKGKWKCVDCDGINVGEMEDGEMMCADCDEEVLGIWKEYKGGMMTSHNYPMVKRLGLDQ